MIKKNQALRYIACTELRRSELRRNEPVELPIIRQAYKIFGIYTKFNFGIKLDFV